MSRKLQNLLLILLLVLILLPTDRLDAYEPLVTIGKPALNGILYSPDGLFLATLTEYYLEILDAETYESVSRVSIHEGYALAFSPDSSLLAISSSEAGIQIWNVDSEKFLATIPIRTRHAEFSPDGEYLAYADAESVFIWDVDQQKTVFRLLGDRHSVKAIPSITRFLPPDLS